MFLLTIDATSVFFWVFRICGVVGQGGMGCEVKRRGEEAATTPGTSGAIPLSLGVEGEGGKRKRLIGRTKIGHTQRE